MPRARSPPRPARCPIERTDEGQAAGAGSGQAPAPASRARARYPRSPAAEKRWAGGCWSSEAVSEQKFEGTIEPDMGKGRACPKGQGAELGRAKPDEADGARHRSVERLGRIGGQVAREDRGLGLAVEQLPADHFAGFGRADDAWQDIAA